MIGPIFITVTRGNTDIHRLEDRVYKPHVLNVDSIDEIEPRENGETWITLPDLCITVKETPEQIMELIKKEVINRMNLMGQAVGRYLK